MVEVVITQRMIDWATNRANKVKENHDLILSRFGSERQRIVIGYLGEAMVMKFLNIRTLSDDYEFDLLYKGIRIEVKSISCGFKPRYDYLCCVNSYSDTQVHKQLSNFYVFTRILFDLSVGWIVGFISCEDFFKHGRFVKKGDRIYKGQDFTKADATILPISELLSISLFVELFAEYENE